MAYRDPRPRRPSLIIRNLPLDTRKGEVHDLFSKYGSVKDIYLPLNHYTRRFQGYGFCEFHDMRDAEDAQEALDGKLFGGRVLEVRWSRDDRKTPREMLRRERDPADGPPPRGYDRDDRGGPDRGGPERGGSRRRSVSPGRRRSLSPRERDRSPRGRGSQPPRRASPPPARRSYDRDAPAPRGDSRSPPPRAASRSPPPRSRSPDGFVDDGRADA